MTPNAMRTPDPVELELWGGPLDGRLIKMDIYPEDLDFPVEIYKEPAMRRNLAALAKATIAAIGEGRLTCWHYRWKDSMKKYVYQGKRMR